MRDFPTDGGLDALRARGVRYLVFHLGLYEEGPRTVLFERLDGYRHRLRPLHQKDGVWLFEIEN